MSDLFETYESDFQLALQEAKAKIASAQSNGSSSRKDALQAIEHATDEALEILDQMNLEIQSMPANQRSSYNAKVRQYRNEVDANKQKLKELLDEEDRQQLFGSRYTDNEEEGSQRKQLLSNNASLERSSERLRESQRVALETEGIGGNILNDLRAQREQITNARNTLSSADNYVDRSVQTLKSMSRRLVANKFISYAIIAVLIILIFLVLASKFSSLVKIKNAKKQELHVTFITKDGSQQTFEVAEGDNLLDIAQAYGLDMEGACGGSCACSTCHVIVDPDFYDEIPEPDDDENDMLDLAFGLTETSRLGCQVKMTKELDGLRVALPAMTRNLQSKDFN
ncbi:hypothetical protein ACQ2H7_004847 [Candidozyma auris]